MAEEKRGYRGILEALGEDMDDATPNATPAAKAAEETRSVVADVTRGMKKEKVVNTAKKGRSLLKKLPTGRLGLLAAGIGGIAALLGASRGQQQPASSVDVSKLSPFGTDQGMRQRQQALLDDYINRQRALVMESFALPAGGYQVPGAAALDPVSALTNQMGGATLAEMQALAGRAAGDAGAIRAAGEAGAASINDIYGGAASSMANLAAEGGEFGGLTPVSGTAAVAPGQVRATGADLANYLRQNQLISAQDQGFLAELAGIMGPAYANQFLMQDTAARAAAAQRQQERMMELELNRQQQMQQALAELGLTGAQMNFELAMEDLAREQVGQPFIDPATITSLAETYDSLPDEERDILAAQGILTVEDYINAVIRSQYAGE